MAGDETRARGAAAAPSSAESWRAWIPSPWAGAAWLLVAGLLLWTYMEPLRQMFAIWLNQADYGHGLFVIPFAIALLWTRRDMMKPLPRSGSWWGIAFFALFGLLWVAAIYFKYHVAARLAIIPCLMGLALVTGGWRALRWSGPSIGFLVFMIPLPGFLSNFLRQPLQRVGTLASVGIIQTLGIPCAPRGNVIVLPSGELGVVEACSGLRMLMLFFAVCIGAALILRRPWWERLIMVASAIPIAVTANVIRITVTAVMHEMVDAEWADYLFHDLAGLLMMPIGILLLWTELWLLGKLVLDAGEDRPLAFPVQGSAAAVPRARPRPTQSGPVEAGMGEPSVPRPGK